MGEKQAILRLRKEGKIDQSHWTNIGCSKHKNLECSEEETTGVLSNRNRIGWPRKTTEVDDRKIVRAVKKTPKISVIAITNDLYSAGVKVLQSIVQKRLGAEIQRPYQKMQISN